ncbi:MAG: hypothetical protein JJV98_15360 [Desulfosarcina sp.]|nr:hypothetical protein [Desulfobacterales bacterium]
MKRHIIMTILILSAGFLTSASVWAMDERKAYEMGDGHWVYFGPDPSSEWTAERRLPLKRSLQQSIRGDALRHYEIPRYEMPESAEMITFSAGSETADTFAGKAGLRLKTRRRPADSDWEVFELPESGQTIVFPRAKIRPAVNEKVVARNDDGAS